MDYFIYLISCILLNFYLIVSLSIYNTKLKNDIEYLSKDKERLMEKYLDLHNKLYKTTFTQDEDSLTIDFENNIQIKCVETDEESIRSSRSKNIQIIE